MDEQLPRILIVGAHPDDPEFGAGGLAAKYRELAYPVKMISVSDGSAGHHELRGAELARIRSAEARAAGEVIGAEYFVWDFPDGRLQPTLELRERIIREIRTTTPDLVITHRPSDYHPDHRAVGQAVQDACYLVTVPAICSDTPALRKDPIVAYMYDGFKKPAPFEPHVAFDLGDVFEKVVDMLACHRSQFFEWLPYSLGIENEIPTGEPQRRTWLANQTLARHRLAADRHRTALILAYGPERGALIDRAEVFEISEYGRRLDEATRRRLFPFMLPRVPAIGATDE